MKQGFHSSASITILKERAKVLRSIRQFFDDRGFFEVETPVLSHDTVVDRYLEPVSVDGSKLELANERDKTLWLQTSPEFCMKRLLASGAHAIYQFAHAFRAGEAGKLHNPEFTMLEWYRVGDGMDEGMELLGELANSIFRTSHFRKTSYREAFEKHAQLNPFEATIETYLGSAAKYGVDASALSGCEDIDQWRNLILTHIIESQLGYDVPEIIFNWPASQSALSIVRQEDPPVAERFELYFKGIELANGYHELLDANELEQRNATINKQRRADGYVALPESSWLLDAMKHGLPACSGVALGVDRLVMLATNQSRIADVMAFTIENC